MNNKLVIENVLLRLQQKKKVRSWGEIFTVYRKLLSFYLAKFWYTKLTFNRIVNLFFLILFYPIFIFVIRIISVLIDHYASLNRSNLSPFEPFIRFFSYLHAYFYVCNYFGKNQFIKKNFFWINDIFPEMLLWKQLKFFFLEDLIVFNHFYKKGKNLEDEKLVLSTVKDIRKYDLVFFEILYSIIFFVPISFCMFFFNKFLSFFIFMPGSWVKIINFEAKNFNTPFEWLLIFPKVNFCEPSIKVNKWYNEYYINFIITRWPKFYLSYFHRQIFNRLVLSFSLLGEWAVLFDYIFLALELLSLSFSYTTYYFIIVIEELFILITFFMNIFLKIRREEKS